MSALFVYASVATLIAVIVQAALGKAAARLGGEAAISREAEG